MSEIRVSNWSELHEVLYAESWREELGRFRSPLAFRGVSDASHDLRTSLWRLGERGVELEGHMLRNFRKYAKSDVAPGESIWNWLALAQHHGVPTRLLDWSYSPYVGLHFATDQVKAYHLDGAVWCVNYKRTNELLPDRLRELLSEEGADSFTAEMLATVTGSLREFDTLATEPFVAFFEPPSLDQRIINQFALFSLLSAPDADLGAWLADHEDVYRKVVIPADLKWEIRDKLDQANVTERVLYPGLDGLGRWLSRYYAPRFRPEVSREQPGEVDEDEIGPGGQARR